MFCENIGKRGLAYPSLAENDRVAPRLVDGVYDSAHLVGTPREQVFLVYRRTRAENSSRP